MPILHAVCLFVMTVLSWFLVSFWLKIDSKCKFIELKKRCLIKQKFHVFCCCCQVRVISISLFTLCLCCSSTAFLFSSKLRASVTSLTCHQGRSYSRIAVPPLYDDSITPHSSHFVCASIIPSSHYCNCTTLGCRSLLKIQRWHLLKRRLAKMSWRSSRT